MSIEDLFKDSVVNSLTGVTHALTRHIPQDRVFLESGLAAVIVRLVGLGYIRENVFQVTDTELFKKHSSNFSVVARYSPS